MTARFDAIVIGTGQSGPALAARLSSAGMRVAIVERNLFGGTCVNTGCIPTKALVASAYAAHVARHAGDYGVTIGGAVGVDMARVKARKDEISLRSRSNVEKWLRGLERCTVLQGHARFESGDTVRVNGERYSAERIFVNVGTRPFIPPMQGLDRVRYLTNSTMMDIDFLPEHLIIVGGSYIGLEFAQMYRRFGARVTVIEKSGRLIAREDEDVSQAVYDILHGEGVGIELRAECMAAAMRGEQIAVTLDCGGDGAREVVGSHLLIAVGRTPNTDDLGLDRAGIEVDERGYIRVDDQLRTSAPNVWALGDCNGRGAFTHTSYNDYEIVAANLLDGEHRSVLDRIVTYGLFIDPPLGRVGMTENEIRRSGRKALVGMRPMARVGRAVEKGDTRGFMKVVVDADTKEILGAAILGVGGDEAIHCLTDTMYAKAPYTVVQRAVHIHPTVSELLPTVLGELEPLDG
ncbi:FAD-containing oxidoreductase [Trinickia caryophylli]|uniref:Pyruvate/2-oxoglutarate dehydrogenase complex, dihydrolipoamide dehydrogenase (E3) component n=1 Tax=Trinickia caryophylli TaxID=28094 RepID=A0A1X7FTL6_TRICW|nr:FAD-containing oxidoreductase [Trinickia caryophylli]PMS11897.1 mercuric reductase [Trinickia caryophylli]TRX14026.1 FAD-containing oxidoreductase [Trinickia caryophylli]WQE15623.1 FAD-containing oxidoreductase [Trinickia caryophylli]SMF58583.1 Pyruvate/2-oxoglutarate dehydrogenase complex, dihydrolipoamide dehydrogenase (E3) component [Trinickia caryophylli]GLU33613.1 mercuric reductase [Trinickia caryophylli]